MNGRPRATAADDILLAAYALTQQGKVEFSEWDLTVATWKRNKTKFGCRGYEDQYPDHKRVMMEVMGSSKNTPLSRGWLQRTRPNHYVLTKPGAVEAGRILQLQQAPEHSDTRLVADAYDSVKVYAFHKVFEAHLADPEEPRTWLGASAFLGISDHSPTTLEARMASAKNAVRHALSLLDASSTHRLQRGPGGGGGKAITRQRLEALERFISLLEDRFAVQIGAIKNKRHGRS